MIFKYLCFSCLLSLVTLDKINQAAKNVMANILKLIDDGSDYALLEVSLHHNYTEILRLASRILAVMVQPYAYAFPIGSCSLMTLRILGSLADTELKQTSRIIREWEQQCLKGCFIFAWCTLIFRRFDFSTEFLLKSTS